MKQRILLSLMGLGLIILSTTKLLYADVPEKAYTKENINKLIAVVKNDINTNNMLEGYGLTANVEPNYQVYTSITDGSAKVIFNITYKNNNYRVYGETRSNYCEGVSTIIAARQDDINNFRYSWDPYWMPDNIETTAEQETTTEQTTDEDGNIIETSEEQNEEGQDNEQDEEGQDEEQDYTGSSDNTDNEEQDSTETETILEVE